MLLIASQNQRHRAVIGYMALDGGSSVLLAASLEEACAHLERQTVLIRCARREVIEPCSVTAAIVALGFEDGLRLCEYIDARGEQIPVLWLVSLSDYERALGHDKGRCERTHHVEPVDPNAVIAWLDHVRPARVRCEAQRQGRRYGLVACETEVLTWHALHLRHIPLAELAREMELHENTLRSRCRRIESVAKTTIVRLPRESTATSDSASPPRRVQSCEGGIQGDK